MLSGEGFVVQTWRIIVAELYACSAALEAIGMGFGWRPPASIAATLFAVFVFDVVLSFNTSVAVWESTSASRHAARRWRGGGRIKSSVASMASRDDGVGERAEARRSAVYERPEKLRIDGVGQTRRQDAREGQTDKDTKNTGPSSTSSTRRSLIARESPRTTSGGGTARRTRARARSSPKL